MNWKISHWRGFEISNIFLTLVFLSVLLTPACNPEDVAPPEKTSYVATSHDPSVYFADFHTYYMSDNVWEINNNNADALRGGLKDSIYVTIDSAIAKNMRKYGYRRVNDPTSGVPDIRISTAIINNGSSISTWCSYFPGWGWKSPWDSWLVSYPENKGINGIVVKLDSAQVISHNAKTPVIFVAHAANQDANAKYKFMVDGDLKQNSTQNTYKLPRADAPAIGKSKTISVILTENGNPVASDSVKIYGVQHGSLVITAFLTNASHVVPADSVGNIADSSYKNCGGRFKVYVGDILVNKNFTFHISASSKINATIDSLGFYKINKMDPVADVGTATFVVKDSITVKRTGNTDTTLQVNATLPYKIYKSKKFYAGLPTGLPGYYKQDFWGSLYESTYPPRTILIEMADPKKMELVNGRFVTPIYWAANIFGTISNEAAFSDTTGIRMAIDTAFIQSPYLNNSK